MPSEKFMDEEEAKNLEARDRLFFEREELRKLFKEGKISEADFKREEANLSQLIDSLGQR